MVTARTFLQRLRRLVMSGALSLCTAQIVLGGCCDLPRAYRSPACDPAWGYHQTCWRQFPQLQPCSGWGDYCPACQTQDTYSQAWQDTAAAGTVIPPNQNLVVPGTPLPPPGAPMMAYPPARTYAVPGTQFAPLQGGLSIPPQHYAQPPGPPIPVPGAANGPAHGAPTGPTPVNPAPADPLPPHATPANPMPANPAPFNPAAPQPMDEGQLPQPMPLPGQSRYQPSVNMRPASFQGQQLPVHPASAADVTTAAAPPSFGPTSDSWTAAEVPTAKPSLSDRISNGALKFRSAFRGSSDDVTFRPPMQPQTAEPEPRPSFWSRLTSW